VIDGGRGVGRVPPRRPNVRSPAHGFAGRNVQTIAEHSVGRLRFHNLPTAIQIKGRGELAVLPVHCDTGDRFGRAITHFHLPKDEGTSAHARRGGCADPASVLEIQIAGQMSKLRRVHEISVRDAYLNAAIDDCN
jgi:hypothetical protein